MKDFNEILQTIIEAKQSRAELNGLNSDSKVSVWGNIVWIVAYAIDVLRQIFEKHKAEMEMLLLTQKQHKAMDVRRRLLNFQLGFSLIPETDEYDNTGYTEQEIEASKIIKYAAVTDSNDQKGVVCKIATEVNGELTPIGDNDVDAVLSYIREIKPAGVPYRVVNFPPDLLSISIRIFRDPLILDKNGVHRIEGTEPVKESLKAFMKELPFNGELVLQSLQDKLQDTPGVKIAQIDYAASAWIDGTSSNYGNYVAIDVKKIPESGYFKLENYNGISYV